MSLRELQQMNLDTERPTHIRMECHSRSSQKYLLLQVWCGLLTVAIVVMATLLTSIKTKSTEDKVSLEKQVHVTPTGSSLSYIQLMCSLDSPSWIDSDRCDSCTLSLHNNSILCKERSLYFIYAQVTFSNLPMQKAKSVMLTRNASVGKSMRTLVEGIFPNTTTGSVWVAKIVHLSEEDSISLAIRGDFKRESTFWGAYKLH